MKELYLKTDKGNIPIDKQQIEKYNLKEGYLSPNNNYHIVDKYGNETKEIRSEKLSDQHTLEEMYDDRVIFTQSEVIDISKGVEGE